MQKKIIELLEKKGKDLKDVHPNTMMNWKKGGRMYVSKVENVLKANEISEPFFWDGTADELADYVFQCGKNKNWEITINIKENE